MSRMPVIFTGHGSPMIALEDSSITRRLQVVGQAAGLFGRPRAILAISAHWYTRGTFVQSSPRPRQIYDMYGFPEELYQVKYPVTGSDALTEAVKRALGRSVRINDEWGIDHGVWTVLVHMFPEADIPVVELSVNSLLTPAACFEIGRRLAPLREQGFLILASGNVVHNLGRVEWDNPIGTVQADRFDLFIRDAVENRKYQDVFNYTSHSDATYAVPTPDHFLPLLYALGASDGDEAFVFNNVRSLGSMSMTGYFFSEREVEVHE